MQDYTEVSLPAETCVHNLFETQVLKYSDSIAIVFGNHHISYSELNRCSNQLAHYLIGLGVRPEVIVGIHLQRSVEMVIGLLGILKSGGAYLPLDHSYPKERLEFMMNDSQAAVLLTQGELLEKITDQQAHTICLDKDWQMITQEDITDPIVGVAPENLAYVVYTSGSTGKPKGVTIEHRALTNYLCLSHKVYGLDKPINSLLHSSLGFDLTITSLFSTLTTGGRLQIASEQITLESILKYIYTNQVGGLLKLTPSHLRGLLVLQNGKFPINGPQILILGGEALYYEDFSGKPDSFTRVINEYGPTEATVGCCIFEISDSTRTVSGSVPIGRPMSNTQLYLLNKDSQITPIGVYGEIHIGGVGLARGYLNRPDLTAEKFTPNLFSQKPGERLYGTGDLACYLSDGNIKFINRIDNQVKVRGFRIELDEIESILAQHPSVHQVVVLAREHILGEKRLIAYVVVADGQILERNQLRNYLNERLPDYMIPSLFISLDSLPLTPNGKLDQHALPTPDRLHLELSQDYVAPRTSTEQMLAEILSDVLRIEKVGIDENFFDLGFDSLISIRVLYEAHARGLKITIKDMMQCSTIGDLARFVEPVENRIDDYSFKTCSIPMLPSQHWLFERNLPDTENYNAAFLFETTQDFSASIFDQVVQQMVLQHDAIRIRFQRTPKGWEQICGESGKLVCFYQIDMTWLSKEHRNRLLPTIIRDLRRSLNIENDPLIRFVHLRLGPEMTGRLFMVISHLICDSISSAILINDFCLAYQYLMEGKPPKLTSPTTSLKAWAEFLHNYAQGPEAKSELKVWLKQPWSLVRSLPMELSNNNYINTYESSDNLEAYLSKRDTFFIVERSTKTYNMSLENILLAVLAYCLGRWANTKVVLVDVTVNGRELLSPNINPSCIVGYFSTVYPIVLELCDNYTLDTLLPSIRQQLRKIPNHGIGYGILRYISKDEQVQQKLTSLIQPQVKFNYSGRYGQRQIGKNLFDIMKVPFRLINENIPGVLNGSDQRKYLLNFESMIQNDQLFLSIKYSRNIHSKETIGSLCNHYLNCLRSLVRYF